MKYSRSTLAILALFLTSMANATIMTESHHGGFSLWAGAKDYNSSYRYSAHRSDFQRVYLSGFDTSKGELLSVSIKYDTNYYLSNSVSSRDYYGSSFAEGVGSSRYTIKLRRPYGDTDQRSRAVYTDCYDSYDRYSSCYDRETRSGSFDGTLWTPSLDLFKDISYVAIDVRADIWANLKRCGYGDYSCYDYARTDWRGKVWLDYTYKSVPEPGTLGLIGLGLLGLGLSRRLRKA